MSVGEGDVRILVVEDNHALRRGISIALGERFGEVHEESDGEAALAHLADTKSPTYHVVITDLRLPGVDGLAVLRAVLERDVNSSVILMTAYGSVEAAVEAMRLGAYDFVQKPFELDYLELRVARAIERAEGMVRVDEAPRPPPPPPGRLVAESAAMREAVDLARRVADTRSTVLITGETGTGKEVIAGLIHDCSSRAQQSFVKVNCAALPETLLESELFGHERGAFTGADRRRVGRFEQASGGTLFLDEIGDITLPTQAKLLRVLQDQEFHRLGGTHPLRTDARIIAATNRDLDEARRTGAFREDLYFRLDVIGIHLPPLRERPEDLMALADRLLDDLAIELDRNVSGATPAALARIRSYAWPGNVRELRNVLERAVLTGTGDRVDAPDLALASSSAAAAAAGGRSNWPPEGVSLRDVERDVVVAALRRTGWVQKDAAKILGVSRRKLNYMIQKMGLTHPTWRRNRGPSSDL
ncbi:MAG: sigma-54-dependent Fis family transcriptional regulator [Deltaproteobacteria bacterium]|nr:sigma-54-dependent Fis family transcriptional regulator [Deltaproteobacteria bacterium]MBW2698136.1 sigma-54-dependent Fis family transcriptional regulator [Deltaproteobacteria bacterium]